MQKERIQLAVRRISKELGVNLKEKTRHRSVILPRQATMYHIKECFKPISWKEVGDVFNQDHSTAIHSYKCYETALGLTDEVSLRMRSYEDIITFYLEMAKSEIEKIRKSKSTIQNELESTISEYESAERERRLLEQEVSILRKDLKTAQSNWMTYKRKYDDLAGNFTRAELEEIKKTGTVLEKYANV